jgi:hypothetical protein
MILLRWKVAKPPGRPERFYFYTKRRMWDTNITLKPGAGGGDVKKKDFLLFIGVENPPSKWYNIRKRLEGIIWDSLVRYR